MDGFARSTVRTTDPRPDGQLCAKKGAGVSERIRSDPEQAASQASPEAAASPERDRLVRNGPEIQASHQPVTHQRQHEVSDAVGHTTVAAQQRDQREQKLAPEIGRKALAAQRNEENREAVTRQLGYKAVERQRYRSRD